jgi:lipopolysaccharide transport protein LptA
MLVAICILGGAGTPGPVRTAVAAEAASVKGNEPILIRADRAWESETEEILYLEGNFVMRTSEWEVKADRAEVQGPVEDPERIVGYGKPASIRVTLAGAPDAAPDEGYGYSDRIVYLYNRELLELHDNARLELENVTVRSGAIVYDVGNRRLVSSGANGVEFVMRPKAASPR